MKQVFTSLVCATLLFASCRQANDKTDEKTSTNTDTIQKSSLLKSDTLINNPEATHSKIHNDCTYGDRATDEMISGLSQSVLKYVPKGYRVWDTCHGNLNRDGFEDMIVVLKLQNEDSLAEANEEAVYRRPLLILLGQDDKTYKLAHRNDSAIYTHGASPWGELYTGITIKNGYFSVEGGVHGGKHWDQTHTFKYSEQDKNWYLYKICYEDWKDDPKKPDEALSLHTQSCQTSKDFGTVAFDKFNIDTEY